MLAQASHVAHVLRVILVVRVVIRSMHREDDRAGPQEEQRLEEGVCYQVKHPGGVRARSHANEHVTQL